MTYFRAVIFSLPNACLDFKCSSVFSAWMKVRLGRFNSDLIPLPRSWCEVNRDDGSQQSGINTRPANESRPIPGIHSGSATILTRMLHAEICHVLVVLFWLRLSRRNSVLSFSQNFVRRFTLRVKMCFKALRRAMTSKKYSRRDRWCRCSPEVPWSYAAFKSKWWPRGYDAGGRAHGMLGVRSVNMTTFKGSSSHDSVTVRNALSSALVPVFWYRRFWRG